MSSILYYSKYCDVCKKYLQTLSKSNVQNQIHFICIDKRVKEGSKTYIVLDNGQKIILPDNVTKVPALLLLNEGYQVLYGEQIMAKLKPSHLEQVKQATFNNMEPMVGNLQEYSFGGGAFGDVVSDTYSFLDQTTADMSAVGNGGMRQMHHYVGLNDDLRLQNVDVDTNTTIRGTKKMGEDAANQVMEDRMRKLKEERDADIKHITGNRQPYM